MKLDCERVSTSESGGEMFQVLMESKPNDDDGPYFLVQRAFPEEGEDEEDDALRYVETHDTRLIGHYSGIEATLTRHRLIVKLPPPANETIAANFKATRKEFKRLGKMLRIILGDGLKRA